MRQWSYQIPVAHRHPQDNKESEWELNNEDGEPIKSFTALKSMLSGCEGDPGDIDGTIPVQDVVLPHLASTIKENRKNIKISSPESLRCYDSATKKHLA